jgi:hypothetical protein
MARMTRVLLIVALAAVVVAAVGGGIHLGWRSHFGGRSGQLQPNAPLTVTAVRIQLQKYVEAEKDGNRVNIPKIISTIDTPDLYLVLVRRDGREIRTATFTNMPVGNGLKWELDAPLPLSAIAEVRVFDAGVVSDDLLDRVLVDHPRESGGLFDFLFLEE